MWHNRVVSEYVCSFTLHSCFAFYFPLYFVLFIVYIFLYRIYCVGMFYVYSMHLYTRKKFHVGVNLLGNKSNSDSVSHWVTSKWKFWLDVWIYLFCCLAAHDIKPKCDIVTSSEPPQSVQRLTKFQLTCQFEREGCPLDVKVLTVGLGCSHRLFVMGFMWRHTVVAAPS